ncbi:hypothetical protein [Streptomyces sp. KS 21]|uniref:hypothetical protein n=1 Tax=Streptomyces sp. KS 21 TaxID=2485150 RepID=UPI001063A5DB|nr:hypothetical protein [Streptomyces sp. KS 21]
MLSDPEGPYREWIYELGLPEAIERGFLVRFEIEVLEIRSLDPVPVLLRGLRPVRGHRPGSACPWSLDWLRHCCILVGLAAEEPHGLMPFIGARSHRRG